MTVLVLLLTGLIFGLDVQQTSCCPENCTCKIDDLAISSKKSFIAECKGLPYVPQVPSNVTLFILVNFSKEDFPRGSFINKTTSTWLEIRWSSLKVLNNQSFEGIDKQLGRLSITDSQLESIGDETFVRMRNLRRLVLSGNKLTVIHSNRFLFLIRLKNLKLSKNRITKIERKAWFHLFSVSHIDLSYNNLEKAETYMFHYLIRLRLASLQGNNITTLPPGFHYQGTTVLNLNENRLKEIKAFAFTSANSWNLRQLMLISNSISNIEIGAFQNNSKLNHLDLTDNRLKSIKFVQFLNANFINLYFSNNLIEDIGVGFFKHMTKLFSLHVGNNLIHNADFYSLNGLQSVSLITMQNNSLTTLPYLGNLTQVTSVRFSFNMFDLENQTAVFTNLGELVILSMHEAKLRRIPDLSQNPNLLYLFVSKNRIKYIKDGAFLFNSKLEQLMMNSNNIEILTNESFTGATSLETINLSDNPLKQIAHSTFFHESLKTVFLIDTMLKHPLLISTVSHPIISFVLLSSDLESSSIISDDEDYDKILAASGYICKVLDIFETKCSFCKLGTYISSSGDRCESCPAGGFYQNEMLYTGIKSHGVGCKECPHGKYVAPDRAPGRAETDCQSCPLGTELNKFAGFRACSCFDDYYRLNRFEGCLICTKGYVCVNETIDLEPGFYWKWSSKEILEQYQKFSAELQITDKDYDSNFIMFKGSIPIAYACPVAESCMGGLYSQCIAGYEGPLCAICAAGYFPFLSTCEKCPTIPWIAGQIILIVVVFTLLLFVILGDKKGKNSQGRTLTDIILARLKIVIGFYQVSSSTFDSLSYISLPGPLLSIMKYAKMIQLNLLQILPPSCVSNSMHTNAYAQFLISIAFCAIVVSCCLIVLVLKRIQINRNNTLSVSAKIDKMFNAKVQSYKCLFLVLFITFPSTCSQIFKILPESCHELCSHSNSQCRSYLRADYSIECDDKTHKIYGNLSRVALLYTFIFPLFLLVILKREREARKKGNHESTFPVLQGTKFLYENYSPSCWYWEILELMRKILVSLFLILFQVESRMGLGVTTILSGVYAVIFALYKPIENKFEHWLQMLSLLASSVNFTVGMLLKIPLEETSSSINSKTDALIVTVVLMAANIVVIGLILVTYMAKIVSAINELRKTPRCNLSCFLSVLQLASDAPGIGENVDQVLDRAEKSQDKMLTCNVERIQEASFDEENSTWVDDKLGNRQSEFGKPEKIKVKKKI